MAKKPRTTTRSYALGLRAPSGMEDWLPLWERIFLTHRATCRGAREYGELFLDCRGGLPATLAECLPTCDSSRRGLLRRGARRMLALGWFSVESVRGAENHPHRLRELAPGQSLTLEHAEQLLRETLGAHKGVSDENELKGWVDDCVLAMTANIRADAVVVNRAAAFADWERSVGSVDEPLSEQARRILFAVCGDGFVSLTLPEETAADEATDVDGETLEADGGQPKAPQDEADDATEPSNASRGVFGDLFGGDASKKLSRAAGKEQFALNVREMLLGLGCAPTAELLSEFRQKQGLPALDLSRADKYPEEVTSSGAPTAVAKRYRKLLVCLKLWPVGPENGVPRTQAVSKFGKVVGGLPEDARSARINALDLIEACPAAVETAEDGPVVTLQRVFTPPWAATISERVANVTGMPATAKPLNEFKRLMFALAARRISQTQTWAKINEIARHDSAVKEDAARTALAKLDGDGLAQKWLARYEQERGERSGAASEFRVTSRMIGECDAVLKAWRGAETDEARCQRTAHVQAESEKFGDAAFYAELSSDAAATSVWRHEQGAELLKQWVKLRKAQQDQQRLKIPRYCHPDPFHHPTWCEFGGASKPKVWYALKPDSTPRNPEPGGDADTQHRLWMLLPGVAGNGAGAAPFRWVSKRLSQDLGGHKDAMEQAIPRADRVSRAAAGLPSHGADGTPIRYRPIHPFTKDAKGWNARLQLERGTLELLRRQWDDERGAWRDGGAALRHARWFVTFAPSVEVSDGPGRSIDPKLGWESAPHTDLNKKQKRGAQAAIILSRLPGLRILSADLGHRVAAACAVWESLSAADLLVEIAGRTTVDGGIGEEELFLHTLHLDPNTKKERTTVYRRIGADKLADGSLHPAPWARLDRQFVIRLQGEERPSRAASFKPAHDTDEMALVRNMCKSIGMNLGDEDAHSSRSVDELMRRAVAVATTGLKRHARVAKIAYAMNPDSPGIPGTGGLLKAFTRADEAHIRFIADGLSEWHALAIDDEWDGSVARALWNKHVAPRAGGFSIDGPLAHPNERPTRQQKRKSDDELREQILIPIARGIDPAGSRAIYAAWKQVWERADGSQAIVSKLPKGQKGPAKTVVVAPASGWHSNLRDLTDWIMGRRLAGAQSRFWTRNVGGIGLTRITTMRSLYQLHKAFDMRARPDKVQGAPSRGEDNSGIAQGILDSMERMRQQRVKQIASRVIEAALGVGRHEPAAAKQRDRKRPQVQVDPSCHAVVIENLRTYRPDELQTRRENKALMVWSSGKVRKCLEEGCQLHGLHLREVVPNYTSRQCSRTGLPGMRCMDVSIDDFLNSRYWTKAVASARSRLEERGTDSLDIMLRDLHGHWSKASEPERKKQGFLRLPKPGAELFVAAPVNGKSQRDQARRATQADLNAAANIGLRALLDPDFMGKWWYVPCDSATGSPSKEKCVGSACLNLDAVLSGMAPAVVVAGGGKKSTKEKKTKDITNAWRDLTLGSSGEWMAHGEYWGKVKFRIVKRLRMVNGME